MMMMMLTIILMLLLHTTVFLKCSSMRSGRHDFGPWVVERRVSGCVVCRRICGVIGTVFPVGAGGRLRCCGGVSAVGVEVRDRGQGVCAVAAAAGVGGSPAVVRRRVCAVGCVDDRKGGVAGTRVASVVRWR